MVDDQIYNVDRYVHTTITFIYYLNEPHIYNRCAMRDGADNDEDDLPNTETVISDVLCIKQFMIRKKCMVSMVNLYTMGLVHA